MKVMVVCGSPKEICQSRELRDVLFYIVYPPKRASVEKGSRTLIDSHIYKSKIQIDDEEDELASEAPQAPCLDAEEVAGCDGLPVAG